MEIMPEVPSANVAIRSEMDLMIARLIRTLRKLRPSIIIAASVCATIRHASYAFGQTMDPQIGVCTLPDANNPSGGDGESYAAAMGAGWVRLDFAWNSFEPALNTYYWATLDEDVATAQALGLKIYATIDNTVSWDASNPSQGTASQIANVQEWSDAVTTLATRYKGEVQAYSIWNEPNISWDGTAQQYISQIGEPAASAIHAADPNALVGAPELSYNTSNGPTSWRNWATTVESQMGSSLDIFSTHLYANNAATEIADLDSIESLATSFNQPVWLTETGWKTTSDPTTAAYYTQLLDAWITGNPNNSWVSKIFFYVMEEDDPGEYNLLGANNSATPSYTAIQQFVNAPLTWNNAHGAGDGATWDILTNQNWNNGSVTTTALNGPAVTFNDGNNGNYSVTLNSTVNPASVTVNNSGGNYVISGTGTIADAGVFTKSGTGMLTLGTGLTTSSLSITGGTLMLATNTTLGSGAVTSNVTLGSLSITGNGVLDLTNNHIIISYGSGSDPISTIAAYIESGYNGGAWNGLGIISSAAAANSRYGVGYADSADPGNPDGLLYQTIEIKYTLLGDANLDGVVNGIDFTALVGNIGKSVNGWDKGDFNYDGIVSGVDFTLLVGNLGMAANGADITLPAADLAAIDAFAAANGLLADVPEPASIGLGILGLAGILARRRHWCTT